MDKYTKQRQDLHNKVDFENSLSEGDLINLIIEARKQRDEFKTQRDNFKKGNQAIAERIIKIGKHLEKAEKLCKLH